MRVSRFSAAGVDGRFAFGLGLLVIVLVAGMLGYMWTEGWAASQAFYFTVVSVTTVGYSDYGISPAGQRFTIGLLVVGIGTVSFVATRGVQLVVERQLRPERRMFHKIARLEGHHVVCGLGRVGQTVCERLAVEGVEFVAVDNDENNIVWARDHGMLAVKGDATEDVVLEQCGVACAQGLTAVTGSDAINTVITISAIDLNPNLPVLARAESPDSVRRLKRAGASRVISPVRQGAIGVAEAIIHPNTAEFLNSFSDHSLGVVFAEVGVAAGSPIDGRPIAECGAEHPSLIFIAVRSASGETLLRPPADHRLVAGDLLVIAGERGPVSRFESVAQLRHAA